MGVWKTTLTLGAGFRAGTPQTQLVGAGAGQGDNREFPGATRRGRGERRRAAELPDDGDRLHRPPDPDVGADPPSQVRPGRLRPRARLVRPGPRVDERAPRQRHDRLHAQHPARATTSNLGAGQVQGHRRLRRLLLRELPGRATRGAAVRVGRQALDWGEGIFYPGINSINPYDFAWADHDRGPDRERREAPGQPRLRQRGGAGRVQHRRLLQPRVPRVPSCPAAGPTTAGSTTASSPGCNIATAAGLPDRPSALARQDQELLQRQALPERRLPGRRRPTRRTPPASPPGGQRLGCLGAQVRRAARHGVRRLLRRLHEPLPEQRAGGGHGRAHLRDQHQLPADQDARGERLDRPAQPRAERAAHPALDYPAQRNAPAFIEGSLSGTRAVRLHEGQPVDREDAGLLQDEHPAAAVRRGLAVRPAGGPQRRDARRGGPDVVEHQQPSDSTGRTPSGCCAPATSASPPGASRATRATPARSRTGSSTTATSTASRRRSRWATSCGRRPSSRSSARASA